MSNQVNFTYANGRERKMLERDAKILTKLGRGTYLTTAMQAAPVAAPAPVKANVPAKPVERVEPDDGLDAMDSEALHELAKAEGIKVHANAGADRVRAVIRGARQDKA